MATTHGWATYPSATTYLTTELNSMANAANVVGASVACLGNMFLDVQVYLNTMSVARTGGGGIDVYVLPTVDGTNFVYGSASLDTSAAHCRGRVEFDAAVTARYNAIVRIPVGAANFEIYVENNTGQTTASAGNIVSYTLYMDQLN